MGVSEYKVLTLIASVPNKSCQLDSCSTWLVKQFAQYLAPVLTRLFNLLLSSGVIPNVLNAALVTQILKKKGLDQMILKNYRLISNLPFVSKLLERPVAQRLKEYFDLIRLLPRNQSAYRKYHSTETALLSVISDIANASDNGQVTFLMYNTRPECCV